ncbi:hypothetical protein DM02DRAFT_733129 [Periconia macrospinosa]|uniref:Uncharacterized protein n=1 Tax=Periconia macrospinosa TaxID=97972 RepID=A0A2V1D5Q0_9PLEO|nr:hypothetical protein DM02DRAFT_733129 [Periconia macrospinosa]
MAKKQKMDQSALKLIHAQHQHLIEMQKVDMGALAMVKKVKDEEDEEDEEDEDEDEYRRLP